MFSVEEKRKLADGIQKLIRETNHPELPQDGAEIKFKIHIDGTESWSWADIQNAGVAKPSVTPWNEKQAKIAYDKGWDAGIMYPDEHGVYTTAYPDNPYEEDNDRKEWKRGFFVARRAFEAGYNAKDDDVNPYPVTSHNYKDWERGYADARHVNIEHWNEYWQSDDSFTAF